MGTSSLGLRGIFLSGLLTAACGSTTTPAVEPVADAGEVVDTGLPTEDRPTQPVDSGVRPTDAGNPAVDAVAPPPDAGMETPDAAGPVDVVRPADAPSPLDVVRPLDAPQPADVARPMDVALPPADTGVSAACNSNADCGRMEFCSAAACDGPGRCEARPTGCATVYLPVCGCDGRTYGNTCEAAAGGVRVLDRGACAAVDAGAVRDVPPVDTGLSVCATIRCSAGNACCDVAGAEYYGRCYPTTCLGCCSPATSRDSGVVDVPPGSCRSNADCGALTQYCAGDGCGTIGTCQARPRICSTLRDPVCGCDGTTYSNSCLATFAGARVASRGSCAITRDSGVSACALIDCVRGQACCDNPRSPSYGRCYSTSCLACCLAPL